MYRYDITFGICTGMIRCDPITSYDIISYHTGAVALLYGVAMEITFVPYLRYKVYTIPVPGKILPSWKYLEIT